MAQQTRIEELNSVEQSQDCGCGCGGASCESVGQDCGCGCGGASCATAAQQEVVLVGSLSSQDATKPSTEQCDGSCGCKS